MKKQFLSLAFTLICGAAMAATTTMVKITMTAQDEFYDATTVKEAPEYTDGFDNGYDATKTISRVDEDNVFIYVEEPNLGNLKTLAKPNVTWSYLSIETNTQSTYTLTFSGFKTTNRKLWLMDLKNDSIFLMTSSTSYDFTATAGGVKDAKRFLIIDTDTLTYPRAVANGNWATICFPYKFVDAAGVDKLYSLTAINTAGTKVAIDEVAIANVVAGKPYIFQSDSTAQEFKYKPENKAAAPDTIGSNGLCGVFADTVFTDQVWLVVNNAITLSAAGSDLVKYRCFIDLNQTPIDDNVFTQQVPGRRIFNVKNTPTGMEMLEEAPAMDGKMIINGQLIIIRDGKKFNAQGQEL